MRVYVSGPMTGQPDLNRPLFARVAGAWRQRGVDVVNPHDIDFDALWATLRPGTTFPGRWRDYMLVDLAVLLTCDRVVLLPGWERSPGAWLEYQTARALGFTIEAWTAADDAAIRMAVDDGADRAESPIARPAARVPSPGA
jgi:Domain of unknown function (DUF4406)